MLARPKFLRSFGEQPIPSGDWSPEIKGSLRFEKSQIQARRGLDQWLMPRHRGGNLRDIAEVWRYLNLKYSIPIWSSTSKSDQTLDIISQMGALHDGFHSMFYKCFILRLYEYSYPVDSACSCGRKRWVWC